MSIAENYSTEMCQARFATTWTSCWTGGTSECLLAAFVLPSDVLFAGRCFRMEIPILMTVVFLGTSATCTAVMMSWMRGYESVMVLIQICFLP